MGTLYICLIYFAGNCENHGYRRTGSYCGGMFGGHCGMAHSFFYLMCPTCRQRYLNKPNRNNEESTPGTEFLENSDTQPSAGKSRFFMTVGYLPLMYSVVTENDVWHYCVYDNHI